MIGKFNYLWRLIATAISFTLFGFGGIFLSIIVFPMIKIFSKDRKKRIKHARKVIHLSFKFFINVMSIFGMFNFDVYKDKKLLEGAKGVVVVANHPTLIDIVVILSMMPNADCIIKQSLFKNFFLKWVVATAGYIKNSQNIDDLLVACDHSLKLGNALIIFPEGTRTIKNGEVKLQRGASNIALRCGVNLLPITLSCNPSTLTKNEEWYEIPKIKAEFGMRVGESIEIDAFQQEGINISIQARRLTKYLQDYFIGELRKV